MGGDSPPPDSIFCPQNAPDAFSAPIGNFKKTPRKKCLRLALKTPPAGDTYFGLLLVNKKKKEENDVFDALLEDIVSAPNNPKWTWNTVVLKYPMPIYSLPAEAHFVFRFTLHIVAGYMQFFSFPLPTVLNFKISFLIIL